MPEISRNAPCPCGSGRKYKKCCLDQDQKAESKQLKAQQEEAREELGNFVQYAEALEELTNRANDLICAEEWDKAQKACEQLKKRFPEEIDGDHRFYEYYRARGNLLKAKEYAEATLSFVEQNDGFDPEFSSELKEDIAAFQARIETDAGGSSG